MNFAHLGLSDELLRAVADKNTFTGTVTSSHLSHESIQTAFLLHG